MNIPKLSSNDLSKFMTEHNNLVSKKEKSPAKTKKSAADSFEYSNEVSFSEKGYENYRKSVSDNGQAISYDDVTRQKKILSEGIDYNYNLSEKADQLNKSGSRLSWQEKAENLKKAYEDLYDEIVHGYENGTRQVNIIDENSDSGYRTLTMEEELNALEAAYEKNVKGFEELAAQQQKAETVIDEWQEQAAEIKEGKSAQDQEDQSEKAETEGDQSGSKGMVGINAGKLARMLASAKTRSQVQAVIAKIQSDLNECEAGKNNGMDVDEASVKAAQQLLQQANSRMGSAENREATPEEEMAAALAALM